MAEYFKDFIDGRTAKTTPDDDDLFPLLDSAASGITKKITWANIKAEVGADTPRPIVPKIADYAVVAGDHNTIFTNVGSSADVVYQLPASGGCTAGKTRFGFSHLDADAHTMIIQVNGTDHLIAYSPGAGPLDITGGGQTSDAGVQGSYLEVWYMGGGIWTAPIVSANWS